MCEGKTHGKSTRLKSPVDNLRIYIEEVLLGFLPLRRFPKVNLMYVVDVILSVILLYAVIVIIVKS
jgi:hypothetical protein